MDYRTLSEFLALAEKLKWPHAAFLDLRRVTGERGRAYIPTVRIRLAC